jgi:L-alanine-DL-glutamate epimerase-like enolase superfamily enzyme
MFSLRRFRWTIANGGLDVVQPDLHYFGGYIRSTRVALMAAAAGLPLLIRICHSLSLAFITCRNLPARLL